LNRFQIILGSYGCYASQLIISEVGFLVNEFDYVLLA